MAHGSKSTRTEVIGVDLLEIFLNRTNLIETFFYRRDKLPIYDGFFDLLDGTEEENIIRRFVVQVKSESNPYYFKKKKLTLSHMMDCDVIRNVKIQTDRNPTFYFVVDATNDRFFFKYLNKDFIDTFSEKDLQHSTKKCFFTEKDLLNDETREDFIRLLYSIDDSFNNISGVDQKKAKIIVFIVNRFLAKYDFISSLVYPYLHSIGVSVGNTKINGEIVGTGVAKTYAFYPRFLNLQDEEIKKYNEEDFNFSTHFLFTDQYTPEKIAKDFIKNTVDKYINSEEGYILAVPDIVLNEIVFGLLNEYCRLTGRYKKSRTNYSFYKDEIEIEELMLLFHEMTEVYSPNPLNHQSEYFLLKRTASEIHRRNIKTIKRVWTFKDYNNELFGYIPHIFLDEENFLKVVRHFFNILPSVLNTTIDNFEIKFKKTFAGTYYYDIKKDENVPLYLYVLNATNCKNCSSDVFVPPTAGSCDNDYPGLYDAATTAASSLVVLASFILAFLLLF